MASSTQVVLLGTGTPRPDPHRSGPATVVVAEGVPYLFDFGPGVIRRANAAYENGVTAIGPAATAIRVAFLTHMHADHTMGLPDLIITPWVIGRREPLDIYGPPGLRAMVANVLKAWAIDIDNRQTGIDALPASGCAVGAHEFSDGLVYSDDNIRVTAFRGKHAGLADTFGFRVETADKTVVMSGDTSPVPTLIEHGRGCDILIHEAYSQHTYEQVAPRWQHYRRENHTSSLELARIASELRPGLVVLTHRGNAGAPMSIADPEDVLLDEVRRHYDGPVVTGHDLDVF